MLKQMNGNLKEYLSFQSLEIKKNGKRLNGYVTDQDVASLERVKSQYLPVKILKTARISPKKDKIIILFKNAQLGGVRQVKDICLKSVKHPATVNKNRSIEDFKSFDNFKAKPRPFTA